MASHEESGPRCRASRRYLLCLLFPVELSVVFEVRGLALDATGKAALAEAPSDLCDRTGDAPAVPSRIQQNANASLLGHWTLPAPDLFRGDGIAALRSVRHTISCWAWLFGEVI